MARVYFRLVRVLSIRCAIAIAIAWPQIARGDGTGVIAVSASRTDRSAVAAAMAAAIGEGPPRRVVGDAIAAARGALAAGAVPIETLARFRHVRAMIDEGWQAYQRVAFELARERLAAARTDAEELVALPGGAALYADASLRLGIVLGQLGRTADAQAALELAVALDPDRPITSGEFPPDVVAAVDAARALPRTTRTVTIASEPAGAIASVDGSELGRTPLRAELAVGQHVLVARALGYLPRAQAIAVDDRTTALSLALDRDPDADSLAGGARPGLADALAQGVVDSALRFADLDDLVLVADSDRRGGEAVLAQRCAGAPARCTAVVEIGYDDGGLLAAARAAWQAVRAADLRYPPSVLADPRVGGSIVVVEHRCRWCRSPYLWGGVAAAAVIATVVVIAVETSSRPQPTVGVDPGQF